MRYLPKSFVVYLVLKSQGQVLSEVAKMDMQLSLHSKLKTDCCIHLKRVSSFCQNLLHSFYMRRLSLLNLNVMVLGVPICHLTILTSLSN
uniref:Nfd110 n=1 Tax=Arundo donax TaxID=35708 RepID=A0A0A9ECH6_ARUDO